MFESEIYTARRNSLKSLLKKGIVLLPGNDNIPRNYKANTYRFRQDSTFLYFFGINKPGISAIIDMDQDMDIIYGDNLSMDDIVWMGDLESVESLSAKAGVKNVRPAKKLMDDISDARKKNRILHYLPPYHNSLKENIAEWLHISMQEVDKNFSVDLIKAVASMRSVKERCEIEEIDNTLTKVTREMHIKAMHMAEADRYEYEIEGEIEGIALRNNASLAYPAICTVHGEVLHNEEYTNKLKKGDLLLVDAGAETPEFYATDITRTFPVGRKFTEIQKNIYSVVLDVQEHAISLIKPGVKYQDIHHAACIKMTEKLGDLGFFKGRSEDIVEMGAHALVFPHGLGHLLGLDVHDMENLGEQYTGYDEQTQRSSQFGTAYLRFGKELKEGCVLTVEPGIYFIPPLIELWESKGMYKDMINYSEIRKYMNFGGIRIEDNILVTKDNYQILGKQIPKNIVDVSD
jgi:Xaa-Pro aminopeptidase